MGGPLSWFILLWEITSKRNLSLSKEGKLPIGRDRRSRQWKAILEP